MYVSNLILSILLPVVAKFNWSVVRIEPGSGTKNNIFVCDRINVICPILGCL